MWIEQGFWISASMLVLCLVLAWVWPRRDV
jgi:hypothetical protein